MHPLESSLPSNRSALRKTAAATTDSSQASPAVLADRDMDALWLALAEVYGHRFVSSFGADWREGAGRTWAQGLAGLSSWQVAGGVEACIASSDPWPPTLPEFRGMCLGIPSLALVRHELHDSTATRTPFTALVWQGIDGYAFRLASRESADRMIRDAYELAREHVMRGGSLPEMPEAAIAHQPRKPVPAAAEVAEAAIRTARELLSGAEPEPITESKPERAAPLAEVEADLRKHYGRDGKAAAAGADS